MKRWIKILLWTLGAVLLLSFALFAVFMQSMRPTSGPRIEAYTDPRTALLIVDIQEDYTGPQAKKRYHDGDRIVVVSNALLEQAQAHGTKVVYIQNVIDNPVLSALTGGLNAPGSSGAKMDRRLRKVPGARTFIKNRPDAFSNPDLDTFLRGNHVDHVLLTGLDAAYCVNATTHGGLNRGYKVTIFLEGIATESGKSIDHLAQGWREAGARVKAGTAM
jgi:nicotinamidase-related amidase